jgi:hypothetical protein
MVITPLITAIRRPREADTVVVMPFTPGTRIAHIQAPTSSCSAQHPLTRASWNEATTYLAASVRWLFSLAAAHGSP